MSVFFVILIIAVDLTLIKCDKTNVINFNQTEVFNDASSGNAKTLLYSKLQSSHTYRLVDNEDSEDLVSVACMRCLCLFSSDCSPQKCKYLRHGLACGYFFLSSDFYHDCGQPGEDFKSCANDFECSSQCVQKYMKRYVDVAQCPHRCESYTRLFHGGPSGCNNPFTMNYWKHLQQVPGCKGVM